MWIDNVASGWHCLEMNRRSFLAKIGALCACAPLFGTMVRGAKQENAGWLPDEGASLKDALATITGAWSNTYLMRGNGEWVEVKPWD